MGVGARLDAIRSEAAAGGVTVVVDLYGKPVGLDFTREAMAMRPPALAELVRRLVAEAAGAALAEGMAVLAEVVPSEVLERVGGRRAENVGGG